MWKCLFLAKNQIKLMVPKLHFSTHFTPYSFLIFFILFFSSSDIQAQCAGTDATLSDICSSDIFNPANQAIDLGAKLGPHTAGGTWNDDDSSGSLNVANGILNVQKIKISGTYRFTYSLNNVNGCTDSATITVTIGGYTGIGSATNACSDDRSYTLFQAFNGGYPLPQEGGLWHDDTPSGGVDIYSGVLDASIPTPRINYSYTYTINAIGTCPQVSSTVQVYISPKPIAGTPYGKDVCSNDVGTYTNFNLNDLLEGEDPGGIWTELSGTAEVGFPTDNIVNIQNIYNTKGAGTYVFTYTLVPERPICRPNSTATVSIKIEELLDLTGATLKVNSNTCEDLAATANFTATLTQGPKHIANGSYEISYTVTGMAGPLQATANSTNGKLTFTIPSSSFQTAGDYAITIVDFKIANSTGICSNIIGTTANTILSIYPIPKINTATLTIPPVCQNSDATITFSGANNLVDGTYNILYSLSAPNSITGVPAVLNVVGGGASFQILGALLPKSGETTIVITKITNTATGCDNTSTLNGKITVVPLPNVTNLAVVINNVCQGQPTVAKLTGLGALTSITATYTISGVNNVAAQTIPLAAVAGEVSFVIPATAIPLAGVSSFTITNVTNTLTGCSIATTNKTDFTVNPIPAIPTAAAIQPFCAADNATVANLQPRGNQYKWFDSATSTVPLVSTTPLLSANYFVKEVNLLTGCESALKTVSVVINATPLINNAIITIPSICQGSTANVSFAIGSTNLTDGDYDILYNLSGSNNATAVSTILKVINGQPSFFTSVIPNAGNTTIAITSITNKVTRCTNTSTLSQPFVVNVTPDISSMIVTVKNGCLGQDLNVDVTGLANLTNVTLSYTVSGANTIALQTIPLVVSAGKTSFAIPGSSLSTVGDNKLDITNITANSCSVTVTSVSKNFSVNSIPNSPTAGDQKFCESDLKTVANLVPNGNQYHWYDTAVSTIPLASDKLLETGDYFVKEVNGTTSCESVATVINVLINTVASPVLKPNGHEFCGIDKPTIQNLSDNISSTGTLTWYDAATNGTLLASTDLLTEGTTYYGFYNDANTGCYSNPLTVTATLTDCTANANNFFIPDGFSPNGDGVNETFRIIDIEFLFPNYTLEIFNRYGNVLFKGDINKPDWDGKNSNSGFINGDAPTGVYFYIIHYNKDNLPPKQGQLYLNR
jgi:gliding motility-associated-like protein